MSEHFQIVVIGAGPGGYIAALKAAQMGAKVAVIEKSHLGGTCLNWGCIPSKALLSSSELLHQVQNGSKWGLKVQGDVTADWSAIQKHKDKVIRQLRGGIANFFKLRRVQVFNGSATIEAPGKVAVHGEDGGVRTIHGDHVIIATGSSPSRIAGWPDDPAWVCTSDEAVHWKNLPGKLLIVGGGVIGCEFACMMRPLGVEVTIVEMMPTLLPGLDEDMAAELAKVFKARGIGMHLNVKVEDVQVGDGVKVRLNDGTNLDTDRILVATGRQPNTAGLGLEKLGLELSRRGFVPVDDHLRTGIAGIWAIGDVNGQCLLAHAASAHGVAAVENALGHTRPFTRPIPSAVYTFPEIGSVGLTEREARDQKLPISIGRFPVGYLGKAMASRHTDGMVKIIRHRETDALLGAHMIGAHATECIAAAANLLHTGATVEELAECVFAHPTISEAIKEAAEDALGMGLHLPPRKVITAPVLTG
ncbi:MAG: dihydrolipoyl dehydrogenase [Phycisphaeraceae bacterium]|nr:dihydrolipoyl dehydrogenase [Phycisphaeraceae bacterium]